MNCSLLIVVLCLLRQVVKLVQLIHIGALHTHILHVQPGRCELSCPLCLTGQVCLHMAAAPLSPETMLA